MKKVLICLMALMASVYSWGTTWKKGGVKLVDSGNTLTVSAINEGTPGEMTDYEDFDGSASSSLKRPAAWSYNSYTTIIVEEGVKTIGAHAFQGLTSITTVKLPTTLTNIGTDAFKGCTDVANLYYAGSPTEWASSVTFSNITAHPCGARTQGSDYYFFGYSSSRTDLLILEPTITEINPYAFYRIYLHSGTSGLSIPGTITKIGTKAFYGATFNGEIACNKAVAPTLETDALNTITTGMTIYIPSGAEEYTNANGWNRFSTKTQKAVSGSEIGSEISATTNITWSLSESGVLTLKATSGTKEITGISGSSQLPWRYFRRLVYKVKLQGEITGLNSLLHYNYGLGGIELDQTTIPSINSTYIATSSSSPYTAYSNLANKRDKLKLSIKQASLTDASVTNLESAPWSDNNHWQVSLSDTPIFTDNANNATWLANADSYLDVKTFDLQFGRSMSNAYYNTFCSPIDMDAALVTSTFGAGTKIYSFAGTSYDEDLDELALNFNESQDYIEAGVPYLIWPANNVSNPSFTNVDLSDITTTAETVVGDHATFCGALAPVDVTSAQISAKSFIFLQANNTLNWASEGTLGGMRAYWLLTGDVPARALARRPVMKIGQSTTAIGEVRNETANAARSEKIMRNGQIYIVRGEKMYNAQGQMIK